MLNYAKQYVQRTNYILRVQTINNCIPGARFISAQEVATALRPFYFVVHPDLFGQFPEQRATNEDSLQRLAQHLEALQQHRILQATPNTLPFYVRATDAGKRSTFRLVNIPLEKSLDAKRVIKKILEACNLSTENIEKLQPNFSDIFRAQQSQSQAQSQRTNESIFKKYDEFDSPFSDEFQSFVFRVKKTKEGETLFSYVKKNHEDALKRSDAKAELSIEVDKLKEEITKRLELKEIMYDCGWNLEHFRGCLRALERLDELHSEIMHVLKGRTVAFGSFTGVSLEGNVMLFTGDVRNNWFDFIKNLPKHDVYLTKIPAYEHALSQVLRKIRVARRKFMPKAQANAYTSHLRKVTTSLLDYLSTKSYPKTWPETLSDYEIVVESEAGPLMISPTGQIIVPATHPGPLLVDFITKHLQEAWEKQTAYHRNKHLEHDLEERCLNELQLSSLTKDDSISPDQMIECLTRLLQLERNKIKIIQRIHLHITNYYSVHDDGTLCIPYDWKI